MGRPLLTELAEQKCTTSCTAVSAVWSTLDRHAPKLQIVFTPPLSILDRLNAPSQSCFISLVYMYRIANTSKRSPRGELHTEILQGIQKYRQGDERRLDARFAQIRSCSIREIVDSHDVEVLQWVFDNKEWNTYKILEMVEYFCRQDLIDWIITNDPAFDWDELRVAPLMTRTGRKKLLDSEIDRYPSESALVDAAAQGQLDLVKEIESAFSVYEVKVAMFAVKKAAAAGRVDTLRLLLHTEWGVFKSLLVTAMERAAVNGRVNVMEYLYAQYCHDESFGYMENVLKLAALAGQFDAVTFLLRHDPSPIKVSM
ncbi:hypothetical protein PC129_g9325 [Phytophthora cactorum]|uniref:Ankyrin repeat-containing domain n=2 Tax=Phytophthora cactorum TaxID=29920 RepID=A0A8T1I716_9STRA|nr:hypothetical protein PC129_g9325 [Phytophthora cactorum]